MIDSTKSNLLMIKLVGFRFDSKIIHTQHNPTGNILMGLDNGFS